MFIKKNCFINIRGDELKYQSPIQYSNLTQIPNSKGVSVFINHELLLLSVATL